MLTLGWPLVTSLRGLDLPVNSIDPTSDASIIINFQLCRASCRNLQSLSLVGCINVPNYLGPLLQEVPQLTSLDLSMNGCDFYPPVLEPCCASGVLVALRFCHSLLGLVFLTSPLTLR